MQSAKILFVIPPSSSKVITNSQIFAYLLNAQNNGTNAGYGSFILQGYSPGTSVRNHIITLGKGSEVDVSIDENTFVINNRNSFANLHCSLLVLIGDAPIVT